jgi:ribosomal protein S18 acetylase RimI-like enzyme
VPAPVDVRAAETVDRRTLREHVVATWHAEFVAAHDERLFPAELPGFVAVSGERIVGHVSYRVEGRRCEITSIAAIPQHAGTGTRLLAAALEAARAAGCKTVWLTTTNDNLDALRFYQRRGFRLSALRVGAVDRARRTLKPEIPLVGSYGIAMRDELDLELALDG